MGTRQRSLEDLGLNAAFWKGKRVLVTGHTGFKGSWMCLVLDQLGAQVCGYAREPPTNPSLFKLARIDELVDSVCGDVRDFDHLRNVIRERRPEIVIHMAAQALVRRSYRDPLETYATNVMGTVHLLEAIRQVGGVRAVVNVTSDKCYENRETMWGYRENEPMGGHDPYSSSKGCAELVTSAFRNSFFNAAATDGAQVALASARAGNVIGGGDWAEDRLIPDCLRACAAGREIEIRNPTSIRPWQLVLEPVCGYLLLAEHLWEGGREYAEGWNFGPHEQDARPVHAIVNRLTELWGDNASWRLSGGQHPHEAHYLKLDCSKAKSRLGWFPRTDLDLSLRWIVDWHKRVAAGEDPRSVSMKQIDQFLAAEKQVRWTTPGAGFAIAS